MQQDDANTPNGLVPWPRGRVAAIAVAALSAAIGLALVHPRFALLLATLLLLPLVLAALHVLLNPVERWKNRHVPGFPYKAPFGNLPDIMREGGMPFLALRGAQLYGPSFKIWRGQACIICTTDPAATKFLGSRLSARGGGAGGGAIGDPLSIGVRNPKATGLLLADGDRFTMLKRAWQPAFAPSSMRAYAPLLKRAAEGAVARLRGEVARAAAAGGGEGAKSGVVCDVHAVLAAMTMAAVGSCAFGVDWGTFAAVKEEGTQEEKKQHEADEGQDDDEDALNNHQSKDEAENNDDEEAAEWRRMGRQLVVAAEIIFGGTRLSGASRWTLLAVAWPWATPIARFLGRRFPDAPLVRRVEARKNLDAASCFLIEHARRGKDATASTTKLEGDDGGAKKKGVTGILPGCFIDCLTRDGSGLDADDVRVSAQTFMLAGYETTLSALSLAVALLARHPDKAAALHRAIDEADEARKKRRSSSGGGGVVGGEDENEDEADADACIPYANAVLDEAMRLFPPGTAVARSPAAAALIQAARDSGGSASASPLLLPSRPGKPPIVVPSSSRSVQGVLYAMHRSPDVWPQPDDFLPERFLPEDHPQADVSLKSMGGSPGAAFMPFGCGARMCIGYRFALLEARTALVALFREFEIDAAAGPGETMDAEGGAPPPIRTATGITMGPEGGVWCRVRARRSAQNASAT